MCNLVKEQITDTRLEEYAEELSLADLKRDISGIAAGKLLNSCTPATS
jgi:hypothetical protein